MRMVILLLAAFSTLAAQETSVNVTVTIGRVSKVWPFTLLPRVSFEITCDKTALEPGESSTCTVTLSQSPRSIIPVMIILPTGFQGPDALSFPVGMPAQSFIVTRLDLTAMILPIFDAATYKVWTAGQYDYRASLEIPCCARIDHCETTEPVSQIPCAAR